MNTSISNILKASMIANLGAAAVSLATFAWTKDILCAAVGSVCLFGTHVSYRLYQMSETEDRKTNKNGDVY